MVNRNVAAFEAVLLGACVLLSAGTTGALAAGGLSSIHEIRPAHEIRPVVPAAETAEADAEELVMTCRLELLTVACREVPAGTFFIELSRQTGIPVRIEGGADYVVNGDVRMMSIDRALEKLLPKGACQVVREPGPRGRITSIVVKSRRAPQGDSDPVAVEAGAINVHPFARAGAGPATPGAPATPIHIMTDEELRADPTVEENSTEPAALPATSGGVVPSVRH
jgi:hypothetical protein